MQSDVILNRLESVAGLRKSIESHYQDTQEDRYLYTRVMDSLTDKEFINAWLEDFEGSSTDKLEYQKKLIKSLDSIFGFLIISQRYLLDLLVAIPKSTDYQNFMANFIIGSQYGGYWQFHNFFIGGEYQHLNDNYLKRLSQLGLENRTPLYEGFKTGEIKRSDLHNIMIETCHYVELIDEYDYPLYIGKFIDHAWDPQSATLFLDNAFGHNPDMLIRLFKEIADQNYNAMTVDWNVKTPDDHPSLPGIKSGLFNEIYIRHQKLLLLADLIYTKLPINQGLIPESQFIETLERDHKNQRHEFVVSFKETHSRDLYFIATLSTLNAHAYARAAYMEGSLEIEGATLLLDSLNARSIDLLQPVNTITGENNYYDILIRAFTGADQALHIIQNKKDYDEFKLASIHLNNESDSETNSAALNTFQI